jgi:hypothetical protein
VAERGWKRRFDDPIPLPRGRQIVTLEDAGRYITKLPKAEHEAPEWQAAMEALILVATSGGPTTFARIGIMRALNRHVERVFQSGQEGPPLGAAEAEAEERRMTDQQLVVLGLRKATRIIGEYLEPGPRDAEETITQLIAVLDNQEVARAPLNGLRRVTGFVS